MENELRNALNKIRAGDALKNRTARYLNMETKKSKPAKTRPYFRLAAVCSAFLLLVLFSGFSYSLYFTPTAYVDLDVNPSIGLTLNRFDRVIETYAYNNDGTAVLDSVNIRFKAYDKATQILIDTVIKNGYLEEDGLISATVQTDSGNIKNNMLMRLEQVFDTSLAEHHASAETDIFAVTNDIRTTACDHHITPAKYLAIIELQAVDPTATFEGCEGHSIGEIRERTKEHSGSHHNERDNNSGSGNNSGSSNGSSNGKNNSNSGKHTHGNSGDHH